MLYAKISTSIFVSNFPVVFSAKDLFHACKQYGHVVDSFIPSKRSKDGKRFVLDEISLNSRDLSKTLLGRIKELASLSNLKKVLKNEGFDEIKLQYMGELWWGEILDTEDQEEDGFYTKRLCIYSKLENNIYENFKVIFRGKVFVLRAKEIPGWVPEFVDELDDDDESVEGSKGDNANSHDGINFDDVDDVDKVPETELDETLEQNKSPSEDPFGIYSILNKNKNNDANISVSDQSIKFPPGFTPNGVSMQEDIGRNVNDVTSPKRIVEEEQNEQEWNNANKGSKEEMSGSVCSGLFKKLVAPQSGGSILCVLEELVKVGQAMGYNMKGCVNNIEEIKKIDAEIDNGLASDTTINRRMEVLNSIQHLDKIQAMDMAQKAKVKWAIEGDENSRYFHGILNKKRSQSNIRGIMVDGKWQDNPKIVKSEFLLHFRKRFERPSDNRIFLDMNFPKTISLDQQTELESAVSKEEVTSKAAVGLWCDKSSRDPVWNFRLVFIENSGHVSKMMCSRRPISLIGSIYKIIAKILANRLVSVLGDIVNEVQSAFISDRQILDGPFILNEVIQWCKSKKKQSLIFKVDFEKAYDSVRWDFLDDVLKKFGFGNKWCDWIQKCLRSSRGSILINGSPTEEFSFFKGLKQGDPLSPFLFILIMESLHLSFQSVVDVDLFKGINLSPLVNLSHMFYADDAVFVGQWCDDNINTLVHVLECFFRASGLRINMCKSKIMGVNVGDDKIKAAALKLGCRILNTPFTY
ncbi:RNA-directed DNA polymerase, eukaryota [Tanacetum coccineum]